LNISEISKNTGFSHGYYLFTRGMENTAVTPKYGKCIDHHVFLRAQNRRLACYPQ